MTESAQPAVKSCSKSLWWCVLSRAAGVAAVVLGGWCLWLGFQATPKPLESEAFQEWDDHEATPASPERLAAGELPSDRPSVGITHVADADDDAIHDSQVVHANRSDHTESNDGELAVASYAPDAADAKPRRLTQESESAAGAWLTGTIEDDTLTDAEPSHAGSQLPAWKRGSKSRSPRAKTPGPR